MIGKSAEISVTTRNGRFVFDGNGCDVCVCHNIANGTRVDQ